MSTKHAGYLAFCAATIVFALAYALPAFVEMPLLWYKPADRTWVVDVKTSGIAMDFYGRCLFAALASALLGGMTFLISRRLVSREPSTRTIALVTTWALTLTMLAMSFYAWRLAHRDPVPPPTPAWYQPR